MMNKEKYLNHIHRDQYTLEDEDRLTRRKSE